jgi:hypothetical protein
MISCIAAVKVVKCLCIIARFNRGAPCDTDIHLPRATGTYIHLFLHTRTDSKLFFNLIQLRCECLVNVVLISRVGRKAGSEVKIDIGIQAPVGLVMILALRLQSDWCLYWHSGSSRTGVLLALRLQSDWC